MISINFYSAPGESGPNKKKKGREPFISMRKERKKKEEDKTPSSGSIPDPESLDFEEYEDEDAGIDNLNGEENEEPDEDNQQGIEEHKKDRRSNGTDPKNKKDANPHDY